MLLATPALVRSKVADILKAAQRVRVVAISARPVWAHDERLSLPGDRAAVVRPCVSALAVHDELSRAGDLTGGDVLVLLIDRDSRDLGEDVTARLTGQKIFALDRWQQLITVFRARQIDPALVAEEWAVDALLEHVPATGYRPVAGGYLDRETALGALAETQAGLSGLDLDLTGLLRWSLDAAHLNRWRALAPHLRNGLSRWLTERGGRSESVAAILHCFAGPAGEDAVAIGLVLGALSHPEVADAAQVPRTILETRALGELCPQMPLPSGGGLPMALCSACCCRTSHRTSRNERGQAWCCGVPSGCLARSTRLLFPIRAKCWNQHSASRSGESVPR